MKRNRWIEIGCALALLLARPAWAQATLDTQLLVNPGGEDGTVSASGNDVEAIPGWDTQGSSFTVVSYAADGFNFTQDQIDAIGGGAGFFSGGPSNAMSQAVQDVDISALSADVDAGAVNAVLGAFLTGFSTQGDNATVTASFLDANHNPVGDAITLGPQVGNNSQWIEYRNSAPIPSGARTVRVSLVAERQAGAYNDGYFDNVSLLLTEGPPPPPLPAPSAPVAPTGQNLLVNGDAEAGSSSYGAGDLLPIPGWTTTGNFTVVQYGGPPPPGLDEAARIGGGQALFSGGPGMRRGPFGQTSVAAQIVNLNDYASDIDADKLRIRFSLEMATQSTAADVARAWVDELDASGNVLATLSADAVTATGGIFQARLREAPLVKGARYAKVTLSSTGTRPISGGGLFFPTPYNGGFFDNVSLTLQPGIELPAIPPVTPPASTDWGANLLNDPGAEEAAPNPAQDTTLYPIPGWTLTGSFTAGAYTPPHVSTAERDRIGGGNVNFAGGPSLFQATAGQAVDVSAFAPEIDSGMALAHLEAQIVGYKFEGDNGSVIETFLDASLNPLGRVALGPVSGNNNPVAFSLEMRDDAVPVGTRVIEVMLLAQALEGKYNDAYFDNVVLSLNRGPSVLVGDVTGDGSVDVGDAVVALRAAVGLVALTPEQSRRADASGDGDVTPADVSLILRQAAGIG